MTENELIEKVNEVMHRGFEIPIAKLVPEARLKEELGLDSLDAVDMMVYLEEKLQRRIESERMMHVRTLSDIYKLVGETLLATPDQQPNAEL